MSNLKNFGIANNVIVNIVDDYRAGAEIELQTLVNVLEDGEALLKIGLTDYDQPAVEHAHAAVKKLIDLGFFKLSECAELVDTCYTVDETTMKVQEHLVIDLYHSIKTEYQFYLDTVTSAGSDDDGNEIDVTRYTVMRRKNFDPSREQAVETFDDEDEAMESLSSSRKELAGWYAMDIYNDPDRAVFSTREAAEDVLIQLTE